MRAGKICICLLTVIFLLLGVLCWMYGGTQDEWVIPVSFQMEAEYGQERISCWKDENNSYFVFLPGFAQLSRIHLNTGGAVVNIDNQSVTDGASCGGLQWDTEYIFSCEKDGQAVESTITFVQAGDIPVMYIDVQSGSMDYIHMHKGNEEPGLIRIYLPDGSLHYAGEAISIKGRGNSSWSADKKPYSLQLRQNTDILGMGLAQKWILLAEGYYSSVNLRNKIVYDFADALEMAYTPEGQWVNLFLNGEFAGLYLISERNEVHPERVDINQENSFLVSMEWDIRLEEQQYPHILTDAGQALRIYHSSMSMQELDDMWQSVENAVMADNGIDPVSGKSWEDLIDLDSWARKYLLEEIFGNHDGGSFSQFFYYDGSKGNEKIYAGPIWDYDMAMGGYDVWLKYYDNYLIMNREYKEDGLYTPWYHALYRKGAFRNRVLELYEQEFCPLMKQLLEIQYDEYLAYQAKAQRCNALRWGYSESSLQEETEYIRHFLEKRIAFLSDYWREEEKYHIVRVDPGRKDVYGHFAVKHGECLPELPSYDDIRGLGWFVVGSEEPFDVTRPIYEDVQIFVKKQPFEIPKIHYIPVAVLALMAMLLWSVDRLHTKKNGRMRNDTIKTR